MALVDDISITEDDDVEIINGDFKIVPSDQQHIKDLIQSSPGEYKEFPVIGCDGKSFVNSSGRLPEFRRNVLWNLENDGYNVREIVVNGNNISIDSDRIR